MTSPCWRTSSILFACLALLASSGESKDGATQRASEAAPLPTFIDVTASVGLATSGYTFGNPIWGDFDNDGYIDLFADNHFNKPPMLYHNNGDGTFTDIFTASGLIGRGDRHGSAWADYDNDGELDLSTTIGARHGTTLGMKHDQLYQNLGNGQFVDVAEPANVINTWGRGRSMAWADYNNDGYLDLLDGNQQTNLVLYLNNGDGTFTDATEQSGMALLRFNEAAFADYNNDGYPDIFATSALPYIVPKDALFKNNGDGTFTNVSQQAGFLGLIDGRGLAFGDYDNDGDLDFFISRGTDIGYKQTLYRNNGDGTFTDVSDGSGLGVVNNNRAAAWGDFDNDGYLDLYVVNSGMDPEGKGPNFLYHNNHDGTFTDVASQTGGDANVVSRGRGVAWGDYDNDGFLDLFVTNGEDNTDFDNGPQFLYRNQGNGNHWLKIKLVGTTSNRQGMGAKITIQVGHTIQYRENNGADGHFLGQGAAPLHFGLGRTSRVNTVTVKWPSGQVQTLSKIAADQELTIVEGP